MRRVKLIQSIQRAFDIINCFNENNLSLKLNEISDKLDLNINTTRGIVNTLVHYGYLEHEESKNVYSLGYIFKQKSNLLKLNDNTLFENNSEKFLVNIADKYIVTARLHLVRGLNIINLISKDPTTSRYVLYVKDSVEFPLNATSSGKLILFYLDKEILEDYLDNIPQDEITENTIINKKELVKELEFINKNGYSIEYDEVGVGISSIAVPVVLSNKLKYTISVSGPTAIIRKNEKRLSEEMIDFINNQKELNSTL